MSPERPTGYEEAPKHEHSPLKVALYEAAGDLPSSTEIVKASEVAGKVAELAKQCERLSTVAITFNKLPDGKYEVVCIKSRE